MARPKRKTLKKYIFDNFYVTIDTYKKKVVFFKIRFNYQKEDEERVDVSKIKSGVEALFKREFQYMERSRHIYEVDMVEAIKQRTGARCSLNGYFMIFDDYEDYVIKHAQELMKTITTLFNQMNFQIILPERKNNYTKTY